MEAIRKIVTVQDNTLKVVLPDNYNNKQVEIIILPAPEEETMKVEEKKIGYYDKYYGSLKSGLSVEEIEKQLRELRDEWNRDVS